MATRSNKRQNKHDIYILCGGTGGHIFPAVNFAKHLLDKGFTVRIVADNAFHKFDSHSSVKSVLSHKNCTLSISPVVKQSKTISFFARLALSIFLSCFQLIKARPKAVIGFGGYATFPHLLSSTVLFIPIFLHEQNTVIGKVNRSFLKYASCIFSTFPIRDDNRIKKAYLKKILHIGMPLDIKMIKKALKSDEKRPSNTFTIFCSGGSQGSVKISESFRHSVEMMINSNPDFVTRAKIYHQVHATQNAQEYQEFYKSLGVNAEVSTLFPNLAEILPSCNLFIGRSGASSVYEAILFNIPSIFVPLPNATDNHQFYNIESLFEDGSCVCILDKNLNPKTLFEVSNYIYKDKMKLSFSYGCKMLSSVTCQNMEYIIFGS